MQHKQMKFIRTGFVAVDIFFKNYTLGCFVLKGGWGVAYIPDCFHGVKGVTHVQQCTVSQTMSWELSLRRLLLNIIKIVMSML